MPEITARLSTALADRYKIESHLGEGGMANVYLAQDVKHDRKVAVKVLRPELAAVLGAERFVQEIKTTANLQHPHILPLFDSGEADSFLYYVMPFIDGETLRDKLNRETQLGIDEAVGITTAIADALDYAHRNNVIHRDIKPENILLHDGRPMVADFGIALALSAAAGGRMTETGMSLGTPHYMSPEQATAEKDLTNRSDIYSLGCVLYEMLTGEPPHVGGSAQAIIMKIVTDEARPVTELRKSVPPHVAAATAKSLEKLAADRFGSAAKFAEALTNPAFALPQTGVTSVAGAPVRGPWTALSVLGWSIAAVLLLTTVWGWLRPRAEPAKPVIRYSIAFTEEEAFLPTYGPSIALAPDGSLLVYAGPSERGSQLWLRERDQLHSSPVPGTEGVWQPFFSPDGQRVGFITDARELKVVSLTGEPPLAVADSGLWRNGGSWGTDGYLYVGWQQNGNALSRIPATGGEAEQVTTLDTAQGELNHGWPDALPNGRGVLFTVMRGTNQASEDDDVAVVDLATGEHRALVRGVLGRYVVGHLVFVRYDGSLLAAPFDQDKLAMTGVPVPLLAGMPVQPGPDLALSPSGRLVYSTSGPASGLVEVVWVDRAGGTTVIEPGWTLNPALASGPVLSPDGTRFAVSVLGSEGSDIWIKEMDGGPFSRRTFQGSSIRPVWSPDGRSVMYRSDAGLSYDLFIKRADGSGPAEVLLDLDQDLAEGLWSSDGQWLVVRTDAPRNVYAMRPGIDSVPVPLLTEEFNETAPALSPDGQWLAYVSDESGRSEVYVRSFPNVADTKQQVSTDGGVELRWAHSGQELFYKNPARELVAATVRTDPTFAVVERRVLFTVPSGIPNYSEHPRYDVSRDDQRFIMFRTVGIGEGPSELIVVENFFEELKAKVGN